MKGNLLELMNQMAQARNEIRYADQRQEALDRRMNRAQEESGKWEALKEDLLRRKDSIDRSIERFGKEIAELAAVISASERYQSLQKLQEETQGALRKWEQKREAQISRRDTMKELQDDFDGFMLGLRKY